MKTNLKLVAGSVAGMLSMLGLIIGLLVWATTEEASFRPTSQAEPAARQSQSPHVQTPALENELATTRRATTPAHVAPAPEPAPVVEIDPFEPELDERSAIRVRRLILSTGVNRHEPTGVSNQFRIGEQSRLYAFVDAVNETDEPGALFVTFEPATGESSGHVSLDVPAESARYRTWAYTRHVYTAGRWQVVVRDADGGVVARRAFDVVE